MIDLLGRIRKTIADIADLITRTKGLDDIHDDLTTHETAQETNRAVVVDIHNGVALVKTQTDKIPHAALCITQWGGFEDELLLKADAEPAALAVGTKFTPVLPDGATVWKAYLVMKFREIYCAAANYVGTAGSVQVQKSGGSWVTGITIPVGTLDVAAGLSAAGDCLIGNADVSAQVASGSEVEFQLVTLRSNVDDLAIRDIQFGLQIYFTI